MFDAGGYGEEDDAWTAARDVFRSFAGGKDHMTLGDYMNYLSPTLLGARGRRLAACSFTLNSIMKDGVAQPAEGAPPPPPPTSGPSLLRLRSMDFGQPSGSLGRLLSLDSPNRS